MPENSRLLPSSSEAEITNSPFDGDNLSNRSYGSIQTQSENNQTEEPMDNSKTTLNFFEKVGYSLGHTMNDLFAGVWFSYTLLFMQGVLQMPGAQAGVMVMLGQVGDAIATPIVGFLTDKFSTKRKWHIFGEFHDAP